MNIMKMKILPTNLREKKRYLVFQGISEIPLEKEDVISLIFGAASELHGSCGTSRMGLWVVKVWNCPELEVKSMRGIIRCNRDEVNTLRAVIPTITWFKGTRVSFYTLGISGTIKSAITKFIKLKHLQ
jgi:ribonuclease P/MRP protein subunit POP5